MIFLFIIIVSRGALVLLFFSSRRRYTRSYGDWSSDVCSSDLVGGSRTRARRGATRSGSSGSRRAPLWGWPPTTSRSAVGSAFHSGTKPSQRGAAFRNIGTPPCSSGNPSHQITRSQYALDSRVVSAVPEWGACLHGGGTGDRNAELSRALS